MKVYSIIQQQQNGVGGITIPTTYEEAMASPEKDHWIAAMDSEVKKHRQ